jgi:hypothetical protein
MTVFPDLKRRYFWFNCAPVSVGHATSARPYLEQLECGAALQALDLGLAREPIARLARLPSRRRGMSEAGDPGRKRLGHE